MMGIPFVFQPNPAHLETDEIIASLHAANVVEVGHTSESVGMFGMNSNLRVFALSADGSDVYTYAEYRQGLRDGVWFNVAIFLGSVICTALGFWAWRRERQAASASKLAG